MLRKHPYLIQLNKYLLRRHYSRLFECINKQSPDQEDLVHIELNPGRWKEGWQTSYNDIIMWCVRRWSVLWEEKIEQDNGSQEIGVEILNRVVRVGFIEAIFDKAFNKVIHYLLLLLLLFLGNHIRFFVCEPPHLCQSTPTLVSEEKQCPWDRSDVDNRLCSLPAVWYGASHLTSLSLCFHSSGPSLLCGEIPVQAMQEQGCFRAGWSRCWDSKGAIRVCATIS